MKRKMISPEERISIIEFNPKPHYPCQPDLLDHGEVGCDMLGFFFALMTTYYFSDQIRSRPGIGIVNALVWSW